MHVHTHTHLSRYIGVILLKKKEKEKILTAIRKNICYIGAEKIHTDIHAKTKIASFKYSQKICQARILYQAEMSFRQSRARPFITSTPALQEIVKKIHKQKN